MTEELIEQGANPAGQGFRHVLNDEWQGEVSKHAQNDKSGEDTRGAVGEFAEGRVVVGWPEVVVHGAKIMPDTHPAKALLADVFSAEHDVFLAFSGGKDSLAVLKLCEPFEGRFKLLWANTGYQMPHVETLIRQHGARFGLVEVPVDMKPNWRANGWPSEVVTVQNFIDRNGPIRLQPWPLCCFAHKSRPLSEYMHSLGKPAVIVGGERASDSVLVRPEMVRQEGNISFVSPLVDWTTEQVYAFIEAEGIELPDHYAEIPNSLDCWLCPAHWNGPHAPAFAAMMKRRYPEFVREILPTAKKIHEATAETLARSKVALEIADVP